jgi:hypothetical protein
MIQRNLLWSKPLAFALESANGKRGNLSSKKNLKPQIKWVFHF